MSSTYLRSCLALLFLLLSAICAPDGHCGEKLTLKLWQVPRRDVRTVEERANLAVMKRFLELHPEIDLKGYRGVVAPGLDMDSQPLLAMAGGVAPDVMYVNFRQSDSYIQQGFLAPLDEYVKRWAGVSDIHDAPAKLRNLIQPQMWPVIMRPGPDGREHIWAIPYGGALAKVLVYRKDLFRKAGLDPDRPPRDWDELYAYAKRLSDVAHGQYGFGLAAGQSASWHFIDFLWSAGGEAVRRERGPSGREEWRACYNGPEALAALKFYQRLCRTKVAYRGTDSTQKFDLGKIGMTFAYINDQMMATQNPNQVGIAALPAGPGGHHGNELNSRMQGMNATIRDPRVREAAWEWIRFTASDEALKIKTQTFVEAGYARYLNPAHLRRFLPPAEYRRYSRDTPPGWTEALTGAMAHGKPEPYGKNCQLIYVQMTPPLDTVTLTDRSDDRFLQGLLDRSVAETNEKLMGVLPAGVKQFRRHVALAVVLGLVICFALVFRFVMRSFADGLEGAAGARGGDQPANDLPAPRGKAVGIHRPVPELPRAPVPKGTRPGFVGVSTIDRRVLAARAGARADRARFAWLIMAPALLSVALWQYYPLARGSLMAFQDYRLIQPTRWVGLDNFAEVLFAPLFWQALWNSARYMALSLGMGFATPILLALALHEVPRGKVLFRTLYYLPAVTTGLVIMFLWKQFYDKSPTGLLNQIGAIFAHGLNMLGLHLQFEPIDWLGDPRWALVAVIIPLVWAGVGPGCLIYLAALKGIPEDVYEAADLDGAGIFSKLHNITFPYLKPLIIINFVGAFIHAARAFDSVFVTTGGGPVFSTHVVGLEIWFSAFMYLKFGYAVAMAWIVGALLVGFTLFQLRILSRVQFKTAEA
jgi:ABC-type sugar transport system permease subunit/ABC-type glycerol-3-phosphate transport system substrate-binding protein